MEEHGTTRVPAETLPHAIMCWDVERRRCPFKYSDTIARVPASNCNSSKQAAAARRTSTEQQGAQHSITKPFSPSCMAKCKREKQKVRASSKRGPDGIHIHHCKFAIYTRWKPGTIIFRKTLWTNPVTFRWQKNGNAISQCIVMGCSAACSAATSLYDVSKKSATTTVFW